MAVDPRFLPDDPNDPGDGGGSGGSPPPATSYGTLIFNKAMTKVDASSALEIICYANLYCDDDLRFSGYIFIDDALVQVGGTNAIYDNQNSQGQGTMTLITIEEGVGAGNHTVSVRVKNRDPNKALNVLPGSILKITELRQAAR